MNGVQAIQAALAGTQWILTSFVEDLSDADLLVRPVAGANHLAWQIGHLINSEIMLVKADLPDASYPSLETGWAEAHGPKATGNDSPAGFRSKAEYVALFKEVRSATIARAGKLSDEDLERPSVGVLKGIAPKLGDLLLLVSNHTLMHAGQFSVVRRKLGKPVLF